ncbi:MAG: phosphatase PAP2 family protein [Lentisphaerae bacterium]|nr:phosphatase PAP2 family protein [Lentisphaerota bacterium]
MLERVLALDRALFLAVNRGLARPFLDAFFVWITTREFWFLPGLLAAGLFVWRRGRRAVIALLLGAAAVIVADTVCSRALKPLFDRRRPCDPSALVEEGRFLMGHPTSASFPSAHAANAAAAAVLLGMLYPRRSLCFAAPAVLIALSRVYVGVHYPLDVLGGGAVGAAAGAAAGALGRRIATGVSAAKSAEGAK